MTCCPFVDSLSPGHLVQVESTVHGRAGLGAEEAGPAMEEGGSGEAAHCQVGGGEIMV